MKLETNNSKELQDKYSFQSNTKSSKENKFELNGWVHKKLDIKSLDAHPLKNLKVSKCAGIINEEPDFSTEEESFRVETNSSDFLGKISQKANKLLKEMK